MNRQRKLGFSEIGDAIAVKLQALRTEGKIDNEQPLLKLDYRDEGAKAPFQYDVATATVHRTGCSAIPDASQYAIYAMWELSEKESGLACRKCRPELRKNSDMKKDITSDIMYGFLSILDQFGSVLAERGKEYRNSIGGKQVSKSIDNILSELDNQQREGIKFALSSVDSLLKLVHGYNSALQGNGANNGRKVSRKRNNGNGRSRQGRQRNAKPKKLH